MFIWILKLFRLVVIEKVSEDSKIGIKIFR